MAKNIIIGLLVVSLIIMTSLWSYERGKDARLTGETSTPQQTDQNGETSTPSQTDQNGETSTPSQTGPKAVLSISFDPDPLPIGDGQHVYWKIILTETKGVGVTIKSLTRQAYTDSGPMGSPKVVNNVTDWFQNLPGVYLPPYAEGIIGAGDNFGASTPADFYLIDTIVGVDDNGYEVMVEGRLDIQK